MSSDTAAFFAGKKKKKAFKFIMLILKHNYQNFLEKSWMEELIKKYPIKIYSEVLYKIGEK
jgi:hypothetical protein